MLSVVWPDAWNLPRFAPLESSVEYLLVPKRCAAARRKKSLSYRKSEVGSLAWAKNKTVETITVDELLELQERADIVDKLSPEKLVLIAGPTFGTVLKFLMLGMALGAAGAILLREKAASETASTPATG